MNSDWFEIYNSESRMIGVDQYVYIYIYIYIYSHPQTVCFVVLQLFRVAKQARFSKLELKPS